MLRTPSVLRRQALALSLCVIVAPGWAQTEAPATPVEPPMPLVQQVQPAATEDAPLMDTVLVTGQRPGPGLWKVSKGDHVLWVFGTYTPLPTKMEWRSQQVEAILAQSQEYLQPPTAEADVGFFSKVAMLPFAIGFKKNPDGAHLKDLVAEPVYARWLVLKSKYLGDDDDIERERPIFAANALYRKALEQAGLNGAPAAGKTLDKLIKQSGIKQTGTGIKLAVDDPVTMLREFKKTPLEDAACFAHTLTRLEVDIEAMRVRANAWAIGDLPTIEKLSYAGVQGACNAAIMNSTVVQRRPGMQAVEARILESWVAAAEKSLATNTSTFATLQLKDMLDPKGYMAALQAKGYVVEKPE
jgi:hypothetical protein